MAFDKTSKRVTRPSLVRFAVLACLCGLAMLAYVHRTCISVPASDIIADPNLNIDRTQMSQIMFSFFLGYALLQIPSGWFGDRLGTRLALTVMIIVWSATMGWMALASGFVGMWLSNCVKGIAQAGIFPCSVNTISKWFPETGRALPSGMLGSFMSVGAVISALLTGLLLKVMTWQQAFVVLSLPGFVAAAGFFFWFRNRPSEHPWVNAAECELIRGHKTETEPVRDRPGTTLPLLTLLLSLRMWLICGQQFFRAAGYAFYITWFPTYLQRTRDVSVSDSGLLTSLALMGVVTGSALGGVVSDLVYHVTGSRKWSRKGMALIGVLGCAALVALAYGIRDPILTTIVLTFSTFCAGLCGPAGYTITMDVGGKHVATVFSTMNMAGNIGAALMPLLIDRMVARQSWNESILLVVGIYVAAAVCWALLKVDGSIFEKETHALR